jgi:putative flippase GtrA
MTTAERARGHAERGARFFLVGTAAAATHYIVGLCVYSLLGQSPGLANAIGFAAGFPVSYSGHRFWTFEDTRERHVVALPRFLLVALLSFAGTQVLLLLAVRWLPLPFWLLLGGVLLTVAVMTYLLSRYWVFRGAPRGR